MAHVVSMTDISKPPRVNIRVIRRYLVPTRQRPVVIPISVREPDDRAAVFSQQNHEAIKKGLDFHLNPFISGIDNETRSGDRLL